MYGDLKKLREEEPVLGGDDSRPRVPVSRNALIWSGLSRPEMAFSGLVIPGRLATY